MSTRKPVPDNCGRIPSNGPFPHYRWYLYIYSALRARANCIIKTIMRLPQDQQALEQVAEKLSTLLSIPVADLAISDQDTSGRWRRIDAHLQCGPLVFALLWKSSGSLGQIAHASDEMAMLGESLPKSHIPILAVPYMSRSAAAHCEKARCGVVGPVRQRQNQYAGAVRACIRAQEPLYATRPP